MAAERVTRKEKQAQTRRAVLDAATTLFAVNGVEGTSMEAIAREAGVTQGAIYSNFASKAELWWAIADRLSRTLDFEHHFTGDRSLRDELADVGRSIWQVLRSTSRTELLLAQEFNLFLMRNRGDRTKYNRALRSGRRQLAQLLEHTAERRGTPLPMDAMLLSGTIDAVAEGLLQIFMRDERAVSEALCVSALTALSRSGEDAPLGRQVRSRA